MDGEAKEKEEEDGAEGKRGRDEFCLGRKQRAFKEKRRGGFRGRREGGKEVKKVARECERAR